MQHSQQISHRDLRIYRQLKSSTELKHFSVQKINHSFLVKSAPSRVTHISATAKKGIYLFHINFWDGINLSGFT